MISLVEVVSPVMSSSGGRHGMDVMADVKVDFIAYPHCREKPRYILYGSSSTLVKTVLKTSYEWDIVIYLMYVRMIEKIQYLINNITSTT